MEEEDEFSNNQEDCNEEAMAEGREELLNKTEGGEDDSAAEDMYNSYAEEGGKGKNDNDGKMMMGLARMGVAWMGVA